MSDRVRGFALLLSVVMWLPAAPALLRGDRTAEEAALLYAGSLLLAHLGCAALAALLRAYAPVPDEPGDDDASDGEDEVPGSAEAQARAARRATDAEGARRAADADGARRP